MIRRSLTILVVVSVLLTAIPSTAVAQTGTDRPDVIKYEDGHPSYVVELAEGADVSELEDWSNESDRQLVSVDNRTRIAVVAAPRVQVDDEMGTLSRILAGGLLVDPLGEESYVEEVSANYRLSLADPKSETELLNVSEYEPPESADSGLLSSDPMDHDGVAFDEDANRTTMSESRSYIGADNVSATGTGINVAVVDTGANTADGRVFGNGTASSKIRIENASKNFVGNETVASAGYDAIEDGSDSRHGTWVASAIAGNVSGTTHDGVAPDASLLVLKALADDGSGSTADIARAIRYASLEDSDVISMSLGSPVYSEALERAITDARDRGSIVVVAAGNSRQSTRWVASPADVDGAIAVGATNGDNPADAQSAYFSQIGPDPGTTDDSAGVSNGEGVDVAAPGMSTVAKIANPSETLENKTLSGTSMATPLVSGALALAVAMDSVSAEEAVSSVRSTARPIPRAGETEVGAGMVAADNLVDGTEPETSQLDARTDDATTRDATYREMSDSSGGTIVRLLS